MCIICCIAILVVAFGGYAEEPYARFKVGLQAGTDVTELIRSAFNVAPMSTIFSVGAQVHILPALSLRPVLQLGTMSRDTKNDLTGVVTQNTSSELAIGGRLDILWHLIRLSGGSVYVGPSIGYLSDDSKFYYAGGGVSNDSSDSEIKIGILFGAQTQIFSNFAFYMESGVTWNKTISSNDNYDTSGAITSGSTNTYSYVYLNGLTFGFVAYLN